MLIIVQGVVIYLLHCTIFSHLYVLQSDGLRLTHSNKIFGASRYQIIKQYAGWLQREEQ